MSNNTTILMIRHAEKPDTGTGLSVPGQERAQAYIIYFQNYTLNSGPVKLNYIFCSADSTESCRPRLTIAPLASVLGLPVDDKHKDKDYSKVADDITQNAKYNNSNILICWHHEQILNLAAALGVIPADLPAGSDWPAVSWPGDVFGWLLQICFDNNGKIIPAQTICINEQMMYTDYGKDPSLVTTPA